MARVKIEDETVEGVTHTSTTTPSNSNVIVNVSIPLGVAEGHEAVTITIVPKSRRRIEVHTERIRMFADNEDGNEVPVNPVNDLRRQTSSLNLGDHKDTPTRRNNRVAFDTPPSRSQSPTVRLRTPVTPASGRNAAARQLEVVDVSDDEDIPLAPVYPPPDGQQETPHHDQLDGRKYYVVTKGKQIGVFYSTWNAIASICMKNRGGEWTCQPSYSTAKTCWMSTPKSDRKVIGN